MLAALFAARAWPPRATSRPGSSRSRARRSATTCLGAGRFLPTWAAGVTIVQSAYEAVGSRLVNRETSNHKQPTFQAVDDNGRIGGVLPGGPLNNLISGKDFQEKPRKASDLLPIAAMKERRKRLRNGKVETLYHSTDIDACRSILQSGFKAGTHGEMGPAVYFGTVKPVGANAQQLKTTKTGCLFTCRVRVGNVKEQPKCLGLLNPMNYKYPEQLLQLGFDTSRAGGGCQTDTPEYAVYFPEQIINCTAQKYDGQSCGAAIGQASYGNGGIGNGGEEKAMVGKGGAVEKAPKPAAAKVPQAQRKPKERRRRARRRRKTNAAGKATPQVATTNTSVAPRTQQA